jgi:hypothetical protein
MIGFPGPFSRTLYVPHARFTYTIPFSSSVAMI